MSLEPHEIYARTLEHFLAPVTQLLNDPAVSEILINGAGKIYFESAGKLQQFSGAFKNEASLLAAVRNIAEYSNRRVDEDNHSMDARLPDGSRVHVITSPAARGGVHVSIRKFQKGFFSLDSLIERGSISPAAAEFMRLVVQLHKNTIISGGTGTGKTSMLNALSTAIDPAERVIVIEDSSELNLQQPHTVYLETQPARPDGRGEVSIRDLFVDSLRMRPDRIVVGEVRRGEALDMVQSMISGHAGALTTVHANTPANAMIRLETLCLMAGVDMPVYVARKQVASAIDVVIQLARLSDGSRRVYNIAEATGLADDTYEIRDIFRFQARGRDDEGNLLGSLDPTGHKPSFHAEPYHMGFDHMIDLTADLFYE